jgi:hypothetical protein
VYFRGEVHPFEHLEKQIYESAQKFEDAYGLKVGDAYDMEKLTNNLKENLKNYRNEMLASGQNTWPDKHKIISEIIYDTRHKKASQAYEEWHEEKYGTPVSHMMGTLLRPKNRLQVVEALSSTMGNGMFEPAFQPTYADHEPQGIERLELRTGLFTPFKNLYEDLIGPDITKSVEAKIKLERIQSYQIGEKVEAKYNAFQAKQNNLTNTIQSFKDGNLIESGKKAQVLAGVVGDKLYYPRVALERHFENHPVNVLGSLYQKYGDVDGVWTGKHYAPDTSVVYDGSRLHNFNQVSHEDASVHTQELAQMQDSASQLSAAEQKII